jgi:hypothetical protein
LPARAFIVRAGGHDDVGRVAGAAVVENPVDDFGLDFGGSRGQRGVRRGPGSAGERPLREQRGGAGGGGGVGVLVDGDIDAARAGLQNQAEGLAGEAPGGLADGLVVGDLGGQAALLADADGLANRIDDARGFVAHVGDVDAAQGGDGFGEVDHLFGRGIVAGDVKEAGGKAEGAVVHRLDGEAAHPASSAAVACRFSVPMTARRMVLWPAREA